MPILLRRLDEIENWRIFLKEYVRLEGDFIRLTEYIPLASSLNAPNFQFGSPAAAAFGLDSCTWLETCLHKLLASPLFDGDKAVVKARKGKEQDMTTYRKVFEPLLALSKEERVTLDASLSVRPFKPLAAGQSPNWFRKYSRFKHDRVELARLWTMGDSIQGLAALSIVLRAFVRPTMVINLQSRVFLSLMFPRELIGLAEMV